jgi:hypothetical protein
VHLLNASGTFFLCSDRAALTPDGADRQSSSQTSAIVVVGRRFQSWSAPDELTLDSRGPPRATHCADDHKPARVPSLSEIASVSEVDQL